VHSGFIEMKVPVLICLTNKVPVPHTCGNPQIGRIGSFTFKTEKKKKSLIP